MISVPALSAGVRLAVSSLQSSIRASEAVQHRLATGRKINSAFDNPASFFKAAGLNHRASDLFHLLDDMGQAIKTTEAANNGIMAVTKLVEAAQAILPQALQQPKPTSVPGPTRLTGTATLEEGRRLDHASYGYEIGDRFKITVGTAETGGAISAEVAVNGSNTVRDLLDAFGQTGVSVSLDNDGYLLVEDLQKREVRIDFFDADPGDHGRADLRKLTGLHADTHTASASLTFVESSSRRALAVEYSRILQQIDQVASDASYRGVNLLNGDALEVQFSEANASELTIRGVTMNTAADLKGLKAAVEEVSTTDNNFQSDAQIRTLQAKVSAMLDVLRAQVVVFGSNLAVVQNRREFTGDIIETLKSGADALVAADVNEESASLLALQTRAWIAQSTLSLASHSNQSVLSLLGSARNH